MAKAVTTTFDPLSTRVTRALAIHRADVFTGAVFDGGSDQGRVAIRTIAAWFDEVAAATRTRRGFRSVVVEVMLRSAAKVLRAEAKR
jgi:hypothetical protein